MTERSNGPGKVHQETFLHLQYVDLKMSVIDTMTIEICDSNSNLVDFGPNSWVSLFFDIKIGDSLRRYI